MAPPACRYSRCTRRCYLPMLGGGKGKQVFCASPCSCSTLRVAQRKPRELSSASVRLDHGIPSSASNCLGSSYLPPPRLQLTEARDDGARIPSRTTNHHLWNYYLLSHIERSQRCEYYLGPIPHHVPRRIFLPRVCPSLGARLTPLPFIASPFTLLSVTPTRQAPVSPGQPEGRILPTSLSLHLPPLPLVTHANIAWAHAANLLGLPTCSPNLGPQGRRVVSATATHGAHLRSRLRWLGAESCFGSKGPVPSQPLVAFWRLRWLLITAQVQSPSKLKTMLARLLTTGINAGAGLAVCHMLLCFQRNGRDKARHSGRVRGRCVSP